LRDVDFEIKPGERVGIIGPNGAGKSTLLKLLSRITAPTQGRITLRGRVASLLEVGTGFHSELTGRENIFLNGAILGMNRREVHARFDEIVAFAEVEQFVDTPVKRYSSGMYTRLAFAVAAHLDSDVLIVDEVLAVGDAAFQRRCLAHMQDAGIAGRTVLFVSHNLQMVQTLCERALLLDRGRIVMDAGVTEAVDIYTTNNHARGGAADVRRMERTQSYLGERVRVTEVRLLDAAGGLTDRLAVGEPFRVQVKVVSAARQAAASVVVGIDAADGSRLVSAFSQQAAFEFDLNSGQECQVEANFEHTLLFPGNYYLDVAVRSGQQGLDLVRQCLAFQVRSAMHERIHAAPGLHGRVGAFASWRMLEAGALEDS
jgi:lipopolysaccharide transport system ATP-binding protein